MSTAEMTFPHQTTEADLQEYKTRLGQLDRRDWWLWGVSLLLLLLLCAAVVLLGASILLNEKDATLGLNLDLGMRALWGVVLLFSLYAVYQQAVVKGLRRRLIEQMEVAHRSAVRAEKFYQLSIHDPLTGLYNRRMVEAQMESELARADRHDYPLTALRLDVEGLEEINQSFGRQGGDSVIKEFARRLKRAVRSSDLAARLDGGEFLIILPECTPELVPLVLERLSDLKAQVDGQQVTVAFSAGWTAHEQGEAFAQFLERTDRALQTGKGTGFTDETIGRIQTQRRQAQKMEAVGRLAGGVAHDFNNMLGVILGHSDLLMDAVASDEALRRRVGEIRKAGKHAAALTRQLLAFSRQQVLQPQALDINARVTGMGTMLEHVIEEDIELTYELAPGLGEVNADPGQLEQVIMNLVVNARDAMPEGGRLTIATQNVELDTTFVRQHPGSRLGSHVRLAISDTGQGIDEATQAHIFEPFFTTKELGKGTGLGLATVYGIVKQSHGYISVESERGRGTTFAVYLPRVAAETAKSAPHRAD